MGCVRWIFFLVSFAAFAQDFNAGWLPKVNVSTELSETIKWVNSLEARELVYMDDVIFRHNLVDIATIFSVRTSVDQSLNLGYLIRFRENGDVVHRFLQHYNLVSNYNALRLGHRIGFEQFFQNATNSAFRTRYRITFEKALNGAKVDNKEFYLKMGHEYLWNFNEDDLEIRFAPFLGYQLTKKNKLEFGVDYRLGNFLNNTSEHRLWFRTTWYLSI
ncbi:MAG: DUF2490 domain-containing protein [Flavobacteriaceae bacterium]|nr:DUF2490 domain-containing protein [Flavobacteriaceae bacterium]